MTSPIARALSFLLLMIGIGTLGYCGPLIAAEVGASGDNVAWLYWGFVLGLLCVVWSQFIVLVPTIRKLAAKVSELQIALDKSDQMEGRGNEPPER